MTSFGSLIYTPETASGEAIGKIETHTPRIKAPDMVKVGEGFEVDITVGPHPNKVEHSIRWIEIYFDEDGRAFNPIHIATISLASPHIEPNVRLRLILKKSGTLYAIGYCNLHGLWEARKKIRVTE